MSDTDRIFDDASYYFERTQSLGLPRSQAFVHTGLYLGWIVLSGLCSEPFRRDHAAAIVEFESGRLSGPELFERIGGVFSAAMLSVEGEAFTAAYFNLERSTYLKDYGHLLADRQTTAYHVPDTPESFRRMSERIQRRYEAWKAARGD